MEHAEIEQNVNTSKKPNYFIRFLAVWVLTTVMAGVFFLLWAYISYELRFSTGFIRAGLIAIYIIPCLLGGKVLGRCVSRPKILWGAGLGATLYGLLLVLGMIDRGGALQLTQTNVIHMLLCVLSGMAGTIGGRGMESDERK